MNYGQQATTFGPQQQEVVEILRLSLCSVGHMERRSSGINVTLRAFDQP